MIWLSFEQIIYLHGELIKKTGGTDGLRDKNLLESSLAAPLQTYNLTELFPTITEKAARLACGLTQNHPFVDGNKRIGAHAMLVVLKLNGISVKYTQNELVSIFLKLAAGEIGCEQLHDWITTHIE